MPKINRNRLRLDMLRGGVAVKFANRTIKELQQHHQDLRMYSEKQDSEKQRQDAEVEADNRLGSEASILNEVLSKPELKSWLSRYPLETNMLAPVVAYIFLFFLLDIVVLRVFLWALHTSFDYTTSRGLAEVPTVLQVLSEASMFIMSHLFAIIFLLMFCFFVKRKSISIFWPMCAVISIAVLGSGWSYSVDWQTGWVFHGWGFSFIGSPAPLDGPLMEGIKIVSTFILGSIILLYYRPLETDKGLS